MGDRVLIQFKDSGGSVSPVCYLHWGGEKAPDFIRECAALMADRTDDLEYAFARFVGICHVHSGVRNTGIGVWNEAAPLSKRDSHGDAGCYLVDCRTWEVEAFGGYGKPFSAISKCSEKGAH